MASRGRIQAIWVTGLLWGLYFAGSGCQSNLPLQSPPGEVPAEVIQSPLSKWFWGRRPATVILPDPTKSDGNHDSPATAIPEDGVTLQGSSPGGAAGLGTNAAIPCNELLDGPAEPGQDFAAGKKSKGLPMPSELDKITQPTYRIAPPDILQIDAVRLVPKPPYKIEPLDTLILQITDLGPGGKEAGPAETISGLFAVDSSGMINLGPSFGSVQLDGLTIPEAQKAIEKQLKNNGFTKAQVRVSQGQSRAQQLIRGPHLVRPDGTVGLGIYGSVYVAGYTLAEAKAAMEAHLTQYLAKPELSVDVLAYNSKVFYVITSGAGLGEAVYRLPSTGIETVLDAMSVIGGPPAVASLHHIWISRPVPAGCKPNKVLKVDWTAITQHGVTDTNYQILPGDRVYVDAKPLNKADTFLARFFAPLERVLGFTLLGSSVVHTVPEHIQYSVNGLGGGIGGGTGAIR